MEKRSRVVPTAVHRKVQPQSMAATSSRTANLLKGGNDITHTIDIIHTFPVMSLCLPQDY